jgi:predicted kinase
VTIGSTTASLFSTTKRLIGYEAGVQRLYENARGLGWTDDKLEFPGTINQDRRATIVLGPPAAGKSTFANKFARARNAAIIDPDEAKKVLPEYGDGTGANAVHAESTQIFKRVFDTALEAGDNLVIPRTGGKQSDIADIMTLLEDAGYEIDLILMDVTIDNAHKRMIGRFIGTGRLINPQIIYDIGDNPQITYNALKGRAKRHGEIDNNGAPDAPFPTRDTSADNPFAGVELRLRDASQRSDQAVDTGTTGQGEQALIPGVEPVTDAQRAQLEVDRPLRGGDEPMTVGLFDDDALAQDDLLDLIPLTREAADGTPLLDQVSKRELLDEIEQDQKLLDRFEGCVA